MTGPFARRIPVFTDGENVLSPNEATTQTAEVLPGPDADQRPKLERALRRADQLAKDLDNYRRHAEAKLARQESEARAELLAELGDILRSLEVAAASPGDDGQAIREGVALVLRSLGSVYARHGLERIPSEGERFDPTMHEAVFSEDAPDLEPGTVVRELSPGFRTRDRVVRPARVSVAA